jgi:prepilin-type N-terminal cleavage/methylation domain-containing protein
MRIRRCAPPARRRLAAEHGYSLSEMLVVLAILAIVLGALTQLFVSASTAQVDMTNRFEAQQNMRLALDKLRREIHCASAVTLSDGTVATGFATAKIVLGTYCPTNTAGATITWCTKADGAGYGLWRYAGSTAVSNCTPPPSPPVTGSRQSSYLTTDKIFKGYAPPVSGNLGTLSVKLPVDLTPSDAKQRYVLEDDIVLRNAPRS